MENEKKDIFEILAIITLVLMVVTIVIICVNFFMNIGIIGTVIFVSVFCLVPITVYLMDKGGI